MKYKTILIDDESLALQRLERLLQPHEETIEIIAQITDGADAIEQINTLKPDLIFLDIQMPELTGFEVLEYIDHLPMIIFSTAYNEYALKAFETNSIDYLLKPVDPKRLKKAIEKLQRLTQDKIYDLQAQLQNMLTGLNKHAIERIQVRTGDRIRLLNLQDIHFFRASDKYVEVCTFDNSYLINQSLNKLESELPAADFVRIHRSAIINLNHLDEIVKWFNNTYRVRMRDKEKTELSVSRSSKAKLKLS